MLGIILVYTISPVVYIIYDVVYKIYCCNFQIIKYSDNSSNCNSSENSDSVDCSTV